MRALREAVTTILVVLLSPIIIWGVWLYAGYHAIAALLSRSADARQREKELEERDKEFQEIMAKALAEEQEEERRRNNA